MIQASGSATPSIFFIADAPHGADLQQGYCLSGNSGLVIKDFCKGPQINYEDTWRTALIKEALPKEDDKENSETQRLIGQYGPLLIQEINDLKPQLLIPLNEYSFNYLTGLNGIRKFRGSVLPPSGTFQFARPNTKVLPILGPHPYLNQEYKLRVISRIDFAKIPKHLNDSPIPDNLYNVWVARSSGALRNFLERQVPKARHLVFDIETYMQIPICISFCFDGFESVCIPLVDVSIDRDNRALMLDMIDKVLRGPLPKVNQNIKYDIKILERWGFEINNIAGDTMLAASTLYCEFPKNLGFLTSIYTDLPYFKDEGKEFDPEKGKRDRYYLYNAKDSLATSQIITQQEGETVELGTDFVYKSLIHILPIYKRMENQGICIDEDKKMRLLCKYQSLYRIQELKIRNMLGKDYFNPLSPKQVKWAVFDELGYSKVKGMGTNKKTGEVKLDEENLELLTLYGEAKRAPSTGSYVLSSIIGARKIHKVIEILELELHPDGRFRGEYNLAGTETGRSSSGETTDQLLTIEGKKVKLINLGHSLQTFGKHGFMIDGTTYGKDLREIFVPSFGYTFVECDLSGAEARVDRVLSGNFDMEVFDNPGIHRLTGSWLYNCLPSEIKKNILIDGVDRYHMSKTVRHAGERNMGADRMVMMTQRPWRECIEILATFHKFQPEIREGYHKGITKEIDETRSLVCPNGRRRDFYDRIDKHTYNEGISFIPQAIVSDQTKFHGIGSTFDTHGIYNWAHLLVESHDGILVEVKKGREVEFASIYKKNIEGVPIDFRSGSLKRDYQLTIPCETSIGEDWLNMKEVRI